MSIVVTTVRYWRQKPRKPRPTLKSTPVNFHVPLQIFQLFFTLLSAPEGNLYSTHQGALWLPVVFHQWGALAGGWKEGGQWGQSIYPPGSFLWDHLGFMVSLNWSSLLLSRNHPTQLSLWASGPPLPLVSSGLGLVTTLLLPIPAFLSTLPTPASFILTSLQINPSQIILIWAKYLFPVRTLMIKG